MLGVIEMPRFAILPILSCHQIMFVNFNRTVLETYWEFASENGTKMKLVSSTFCFSVHFLWFSTFSRRYFRKTKHVTSKMFTFSQTDPMWFYRKSGIKLSNFDISRSAIYKTWKHSQPTYCPNMSSILHFRDVIGSCNTSNCVLESLHGFSNFA